MLINHTVIVVGSSRGVGVVGTGGRGMLRRKKKPTIIAKPWLSYHHRTADIRRKSRMIPVGRSTCAVESAGFDCALFSSRRLSLNDRLTM